MLSKRVGLIAACLAVAILALTVPASAATYTWTPTAAGTTYNWNDLTSPLNNWGLDGASPNAFPNAIDDIANLNISLAGAQTIRLNEVITVGTINLGDTASTYVATTIAPNGGSLVMDVSSGSATIAKATTGNNVTDIISANIQLNDNLVVNNAATSSTGGVTLSGIISESGGAKTLTKTGAGILTLSGANNFTGGVTLNAGTLTLSNGAALGATASTLTINGGTVAVNSSLTNNNSIVATGNFSMTTSSNNTNTGTGTFKISKPITITGGGDNNPWQGLVISNVITDAAGNNTLNALDISWVESGSTTGITLSRDITLRGNQTLSVSNNQSMTGFQITGAIVDGSPSNGYGVTFAGSSVNPIGSNIGRGCGIALMGANTYTGTTTINSGVTVMLGLGSATTSTSGSLNPSSAIVNNGYLVFNRSDTITQGSGGQFGTISGAGQVVQNTGTTVLNAANTYFGGTTIQGGTLNINGDSAIGTAGAKLTFNGGTLQFASSSTVDIARPVVMTGAGTVDTSLAGGTISGMISGTGKLTKTGSNDLTLSGLNSFTGDTVVSGGKVVMGNALALQFSAYDTTGSNGTIGLNLTGYTTPTLGGLVGSVNLNAALAGGYGSITTLTLNPQSGKTPSYSGIIGTDNTTMALTKAGLGTQTLTGANAYTGTTTINGGTLVADTATNATILQSSSALAFTGTGTFQLKGLSGQARSQVLNGLTLTAGAATVDANNVSGGTSTTIDLTGPGTTALGITRTAGATVDFKASAGTFGSTAVIKTAQANGTTTGIIGPWATVGGGANWAANANDGSNIVTAYAGYTDIALGGVIADAANNVRINATGTGNITLGATTTTINTLMQNWTGAAIVDTASKTLRLGASGGILVATGKQALTIGTAANSGTLTAGGADNTDGELILNNSSSNGLTINSVIANNGSGKVSVVKSGTGTVTLATANTYNGGTTLNAGTLIGAQLGSFGTGTMTINGGWLQVNQNYNPITVSAVVLNGDFNTVNNGGSGVVFGNSAPITLNAPILVGANHEVWFGGSISSSAGYTPFDIKIAAANSGNAPVVRFNAPITLAANQTIISYYSGGKYVYTGAMGQSGGTYGLTVAPNTTVQLAADNTFTGAVVVSGTLQVGGQVTNAAGNGSEDKAGYIQPSSITINPGGTLVLNDQNLGIKGRISTSTTIVNNGTFKLGGNVAEVQGADFPSGISGVGSLSISGTRANYVTLNGTNTYSGGTSVIYTGGGGPVVLNINSANAIGTGPLTLSQSGSNNATIDNTSGSLVTLATNNAQNWNGPITFTGTNDLDLGTGTVTLGASPTVTVTAKALTVGGAVNGASYTLTKNGAGTLLLNGMTTLGSLTIADQTGATFSPMVVGSGGSLSVGAGASNQLIIGYGTGTGAGLGSLDVSQAASFTTNVGTLAVGQNTGRRNGFNGTVSSLALGTNNTITATSMYVGNVTVDNGAGVSGGSGAVTTPDSGSTTIHTNNLYVGMNDAPSAAFTLGSTSSSTASLTLDGVAGDTTRANLTIGQNTFTNSNGPTAKMDLTNGSASLKLGAVVIGSSTNTKAATGQLLLGASATNRLNVSVTSGNAIKVGSSTNTGAATGTLTIGNLDTTYANAIATDSATDPAVLIGYKGGAGAATGTLNLKAGTLTITTGGSAAIAGGGGTSTLNLGETSNVKLIAGANSADWINGLTTAEIKSFGATLDTNGKTVGMSQAFSGAGGLTKAGTGTLTLSGASTYGGTTAVNVGALLVTNTTGSATGTGSVTVAGSATLGGRGRIDGPITLQASSYLTPGNAGPFTSAGGIDATAGATVNWALTALTADPDERGYGFSAINLTGGNLALGTASTLALDFSQLAETFQPGYGDPDPFWTTNHTWKLIDLSGTATNTSGLKFASIIGGAAPAGGSFSTAFGTDADSGDLMINYTYAGGNNSQILIASADSFSTETGASARTISLDRVLAGGSVATDVLTINKSGSNGTTYTATPGGDVTGSTFAGGSITDTASGTITLNTSSTGVKTGTLTIDNTAGDSAVVGQGSRDADDVFTVTATAVAKRGTAGSDLLASPVDLGFQHAGADLSGSNFETTVSTTGPDDHYTRVTVAGSSPYATGRFDGTGTVYDGLNTGTSQVRTVSGPASVAIGGDALTTLAVTTAESGLNEGDYVSVAVNYTASVFSGTAAWAGGAGNWGSGQGGNWTAVGGGVAAAPGTIGGFTTTDTATFSAPDAPATVTLNGVQPSLNALSLAGSGANVYTIDSTGGGSLTLAGAGASVTVGSGSHEIAAPVALGGATAVDVADTSALTVSGLISGSDLTKTGPGTLTLTNSGNSYSGTTVTGGTLVIGSAGALPAGRSLSIGSGGTLILGGGMAMGTAAQSAEPVPEPGTLALLAIAALAGVMIWRKRR